MITLSYEITEVEIAGIISCECGQQTPFGAEASKEQGESPCIIPCSKCKQQYEINARLDEVITHIRKVELIKVEN